MHPPFTRVNCERSAMAEFVLKVQKKKDPWVALFDLTPQDTIAKLNTKLAQETGVAVKAMRVYVQRSKREVQVENETATIGEAGIISGDTLIVEEKRLMRKDIPGDNSCLFVSLNYVLNGNVDPGCASFMREIIASMVASDPQVYCRAFLGKDNYVYCEWILKPDSWGGAIELSILSKYYGIEIAVVDSINGVLRRFGEDQHYAKRVFLIFDGIHYDPLYYEPLDGENVQTIFSTDDTGILMAAEQLAKEVKSSHQFTDVQKLALICNDCNLKLKGHIAAEKHAQETGHINFQEVHA